MTKGGPVPVPAVAATPRAGVGPLRVSLLLAWTPMWVLYAGILAAVHNLPLFTAAVVALRFAVPAALMGLGVQALVARWPWPARLSAGFVGRHVSSAALYGGALTLLVLAQESLVRGRLWLDLGWRVLGIAVLGVWLYVMIASFTYTVEEGRRAARAEAVAARTQLAALRGQLQPHFLFNALHSVVHLIPVQPATAARAAEELAGLLRAATTETRDLVPLHEERAFVQRYLALEQLRFEDRLMVDYRWDTDIAHALVPSFSIQTLVENAVRHGAARRVGPTHLRIDTRALPDIITVSVTDSGNEAGRPFVRAGGTGLDRLQERLGLLFGATASCTVQQTVADQVEARLTLPRLDDA